MSKIRFDYLLAYMEDYASLQPAMRKTMTLKLAKEIALASITEAEIRGWQFVISILDDGGHLVYLERMDGVQIASIEVSQEKARTAVRFKRSTTLISEAINQGRVDMLSMPGCLAVAGGLPLLADGQLIGAIGVSGQTSAQDEIIASYGVDLLQKILDGNGLGAKKKRDNE